MGFILYWVEWGVLVEGVANFKYLGRVLEQTYDGWPDIRRNIKRARAVWGRLVNLLRMERVDPRVAEMFYMAVSQEVYFLAWRLE